MRCCGGDFNRHVVLLGKSKRAYVKVIAGEKYSLKQVSIRDVALKI